MALYVVSYDLTGKDHDYESLWRQLECRKAIRVLYSLWFIVDEKAELAVAIADDLNEHIVEGDRLLVQEMATGAAWLSLWISDNEMEVLIQSARF